MIGRAAACALLLALGVPVAARAQQRVFHAYLLNVGLWNDRNSLIDRQGSDFQRVRLMASPRWGAVSADVAYESFLTLFTRAGSPFAGTLGAPSSDEWLPLQGTIASGSHSRWTHRVDRLAVQYATSRVEVTVGRQAISWATTLFLTPADPFAPFDPSDPFREYRAGVDAARVRVFTGAFSDVDGVVRIADTPLGRKVTAAVRAKGMLGGVETSGWAGTVFGEAAAAAAATVTAGGAAFRGELEVRRSGGETIARGTVGVDRSFEVAGRTLYAVAEYQRDGFGAASANELLASANSAPAQRGELQVFGRDEIATQVTFQLHPLVSLEALSLLNLDDASVLFAPAVSWSAGANLTLRGGAFIGVGQEVNPMTAGPIATLPGSEYGPVPLTLYVSAAAFF